MNKKEVRSTEFKSIVPGKFYLIYTNISISAKTPTTRHFGKYSHLGIIGYHDISWRPHDPPLQNLGIATPPTPRIDAHEQNYEVIGKSIVLVPKVSDEKKSNTLIKQPLGQP